MTQSASLKSNAPLEASNAAAPPPYAEPVRNPVLEPPVVMPAKSDSPAHHAAASTPVEAACLRVLVVDDDAAVTRGLKLNLSDQFDVVTANDGAEALRLLDSGEPVAVVITDLRMPGMDGVELLEEVKSRFPDVVRIMLSGTVDVAASIRAVNAGGVQHMLLKPSTSEQLAATLASAVHDYVARQHERSLAYVDPLLKIGTRRALDEAASRIWGLALRYRRSFALVMADIDHFKRYNDTYGHLAGDEALRKVARSMRLQKRSSDELFRFGGEEFVLLLPEADILGVQRAMERFLLAVRLLAIPHRTSELGQLTISLGAAVYAQDSVGAFSELLELADRALYMSKQAGRDQATVWHHAPR